MKALNTFGKRQGKWQDSLRIKLRTKSGVSLV
jgi:hypothetical protein